LVGHRGSVKRLRPTRYTRNGWRREGLATLAQVQCKKCAMTYGNDCHGRSAEQAGQSLGCGWTFAAGRPIARAMDLGIGFAPSLLADETRSRASLLPCARTALGSAPPAPAFLARSAGTARDRS